MEKMAEVLETVTDEWDMPHLERIAWRKAGRIPGWKAFYFEAIGDDELIKGGVPAVVTRGPNKGRRTWRNVAVTSVVISRSEMVEEERRYVAQTGKCASCLGKGEMVFSWTKDKGFQMRQCPQCTGTGRGE